MSAGQFVASVPVLYAGRPQSFNPALSLMEGRPVVLSPDQLRLHPALKELGWSGTADEFHIAARLTNGSLTEPILVAANGAILAGFGRWHLAIFEQKREIHCIEYPLSEDKSLQFILTHHQTRCGWNSFVRIRLALALEANLQQRALDNMRAGGKYKGSANLPDVQRIDVRQEVAKAAGVSARNVANVKALLKIAHPRLIEALRDGTLTINRAMRFCKLPPAKQLEEFIRDTEQRATNKVIRRSIPSPKTDKTSFDAVGVISALQQQEARRPGSVVVRVGRHQRTVILVGRDLLREPYSQKESNLQAPLRLFRPFPICVTLLFPTLHHIVGRVSSTGCCGITDENRPFHSKPLLRGR